MTEIISLGCGGGRIQTIDQTFRTGGFRIHDDFKMHVDPGPGALLLTKQLGLDALDLDAVFVSHSHPDHYADAEVLIEAMSREEDSHGIFIGSRSTINGEGDLGPVISNYHRNKAGEVELMEPEESFQSNNLEIEATPTEHSDSTGIGFKIYTDSGVLGYTSDTEYFDNLPDIFGDARVLMVNVTRPGDRRIDGHLCSDDLIKILDEVKPDLSVLLHMGMLFLRNSPRKEASYIEDKTGVRTIPGYVGTRIEVDEEIQLTDNQEQIKLDDFS